MRRRRPLPTALLVSLLLTACNVFGGTAPYEADASAEDTSDTAPPDVADSDVKREPVCEDERLRCDNACVDVTSNLQHCGRCDNACFQVGEVCEAGACVAVQDDCGGDPCGYSGWCSAGSCECGPGYVSADCSSCDATWVQDESASKFRCYPGEPTRGNDDDNVLEGGDGPDHLRGSGGDDTLTGGGGDDLLHGGSENDRLDGGADGDEIYGGDGNDIILGGDGSDVLFGDDGHDVIDGQAGNDTLIGGEGTDLLSGGAGDDHYLLDGEGSDVIDDSEGANVARCAAGVRLVRIEDDGDEVVLGFDSGGEVRIVHSSAIDILGCR